MWRHKSSSIIIVVVGEGLSRLSRLDRGIKRSVVHRERWLLCLWLCRYWIRSDSTANILRGRAIYHKVIKFFFSRIETNVWLLSTYTFLSSLSGSKFVECPSCLRTAGSCFARYNSLTFQVSEVDKIQLYITIVFGFRWCLLLLWRFLWRVRGLCCHIFLLLLKTV